MIDTSLKEQMIEKFKQPAILALVRCEVAIALVLLVTPCAESAESVNVKMVTPQEFWGLFVEMPRALPALEDERRNPLRGKGIFRMYADADGKIRKIGIVKSTGRRDLDLLTAEALMTARVKPGRRREIDMPVAY